jgi:hypothetical protein
MQAMVKCSNCGAEITNLNFTWGKKYWLWSILLIIPILLIGFYPLYLLQKPKGDYRQDLQIKVLDTRMENGNLQILGTINNQGKSTWDNIEIAVDFFNAKGEFIDKQTGRVSGSIEPGGSEHFKIEILNPSERIRADGVRKELKIASAYSNRF